MSNYSGRLLYSTKVDRLKYGSEEVHVGVYGIFKSIPAKGEWSYYLISFTDTQNKLKLTNHWHSYSHHDVTFDTISSYSKSVNSIEEGQKLCDEYKQKWETGSNNTVQENRENKITKILT